MIVNPGKNNPSPFGDDNKNACLANSFLQKELLLCLHNWLSKKKDIFLFQGRCGCAKTWHCAALYNWVLDTTRHDVQYRFWGDLMMFLKQNFNTPALSEQSELFKLTDAKYLILDDIGSDINSEWQNKILFNIIDSRYKRRLPTFITTNLTEEQINQNLGQRIHSRLMDIRNTIIEDWHSDYRQTNRKNNDFDMGRHPTS